MMDAAWPFVAGVTVGLALSGVDALPVALPVAFVRSVGATVLCLPFRLVRGVVARGTQQLGGCAPEHGAAQATGEVGDDGLHSQVLGRERSALNAQISAMYGVRSSRRALLNAPNPTTFPLWMNFGMWENGDGDGDGGVGAAAAEQPRQRRFASEFAEACRRLAMHLGRAVRMHDADVVLDVGCGCGEQDFAFIEVCHGGASATLVPRFRLLRGCSNRRVWSARSFSRCFAFACFLAAHTRGLVRPRCAVGNP